MRLAHFKNNYFSGIFPQIPDDNAEMEELKQAVLDSPKWREFKTRQTKTTLEMLLRWGEYETVEEMISDIAVLDVHTS